MKQIFSNKQIYNIYLLLSTYLINENNELILPLKINFYLLSNFKTISDKAEIIEQMRQKIGKKYGEYNSNNNSYSIKPENLENAQNELNALLEMEQSIDIYKISLSDLEGVELTTHQMQALLFMIED